MFCSIIFNTHFKEVRSVLPVRRFLSLVLALLIPFAAAAESDWANARVSKKRNPEFIETVPWDQIGDNNPGQYHFLLLCIDQWKTKPRPEGIDPPTDSEGSRRNFFGDTDGIVILTLDTVARRIMITSIVRDALIARPDSTEKKQHAGRINYVYNDYGPDALCRLISEHLGIRIEKYMLFNFSQIQDIIDLESLDGVYVYLKKSEIAYLARYAVPRHSTIKAEGYFTAKGDPLALHCVTKSNLPLDFSIPADTFARSANGTVQEETSFTGSNGSSITFMKKGECLITLDDGTEEKGFYSYEHGRLAVMTGADVFLNPRAPEGTYHLKGHAALLYMRIRKSSRNDTDFIRTQRVRNVLSALADQCRAFSLEEANALANSIMEHKDVTNMNLQDMLDAASLAWNLRDCTIEEFRVPKEDDVRSIDYAGMSALEINWTSTRAKYHEFLDHTTLTRDFDFLVDDE